MTKFNIYDYLNLKDNQVLKLKIKGREEPFFVTYVSRSVVQAYQPEFTPITKINLDVVKSLEAHKADKNDYDNKFKTKVEPEEIEDFELIEI